MRILSDANSFKPTESNNPRVMRSLKPRSQKQWAGIGFLLFASPPVALGFYRLYQTSEYYASLPPGTAACGLGSVAALMMITIVGPACGLIGFTIG